MIVKVVFRVMVFVLIICTASCAKEFKELDGPSFQKKWRITHLQSALVWRYLGEKDDFHFFALDIADLQNDYFKVNKKYIEVTLDQPKVFTLDEDQWIGLEVTQIKFKFKVEEKDRFSPSTGAPVIGSK